MAGWASAIGALLTLVTEVFRYFRDRRLIATGRLEAETEAKKEAEDAIAKANEVREAVRAGSDADNDRRLHEKYRRTTE